MHRKGKKRTIVASATVLFLILFFHSWFKCMLGIVGTILLAVYPVSFILYFTYSIILQDVKRQNETRIHQFLP